VIFIAPQLNYIRRLTGGSVGDDQIVLGGSGWHGAAPRYLCMAWRKSLTMPASPNFHKKKKRASGPLPNNREFAQKHCVKVPATQSADLLGFTKGVRQITMLDPSSDPTLWAASFRWRY
jgi:hypothetical protein